MKKIILIAGLLLATNLFAETKAISCKEIPEGKREKERIIVFDLDSDSADTAEWTTNQINRRGKLKYSAFSAEFIKSPSYLRFIIQDIWLLVMDVSRKDLSFSITADGVHLSRGQCKLIEVDVSENIL